MLCLAHFDAHQLLIRSCFSKMFFSCFVYITFIKDLNPLWNVNMQNNSLEKKTWRVMQHFRSSIKIQHGIDLHCRQVFMSAENSNEGVNFLSEPNSKWMNILFSLLNIISYDYKQFFYSSYTIKKTQNEHLNIICQTLNCL